MPLDLPPPDETPLLRSPLALTVCQLRFEEMPVVSSSQVVLDVQKALGGREGEYPKIEKNMNQTVTVALAEGGVQPSLTQQQTGWRLTSADGKWIAYLMPDVLSLETSAYSTWEDFQERFTRLLQATTQHVGPTLEQRLGVRYVNRISEPPVDHPREWRDYISPELLGPALHAALGLAITASQQQLDLDAGPDVRCSIRHGFFPDASRSGAPSYVLDYDVYREGWRPFNESDVTQAIAEFHTLVLQLFQASLTSEMLRLLGGSHV